MYRRLLASIVLAVAAASASADLTACGDKFLRVGRSQRNRNYAAVHAVSILLYTPDATAKGLKEFEAFLKNAGHTTVAIRDRALLSNALTAARYDLIITDYANIPALRQQFERGPGEPAVLPILHKPTKLQEKQAVDEYHCIIKPEDMTKFDALAEIDHLMDFRLKQAQGAVPQR